MSRKTTLYFAYGSNLCPSSMAVRCPAATPVGAAELDGWRMIFRGVADIEEADDRRCVGAVWRITADCEDALDRYEGVRGGFYRKEYVTVRIRKNGRTRLLKNVLAYVMNYDITDNRSMPSPGYLSTIANGFRYFKLDPAELNRSLAETYDRVTGKGVTKFVPQGPKRMRGIVPGERRSKPKKQRTASRSYNDRSLYAAASSTRIAATTRSGRDLGAAIKKATSIHEQRKAMSPATRRLFDLEQQERAEARRSRQRQANDAALAVLTGEEA